jgi:hypothetical protein
MGEAHRLGQVEAAQALFQQGCVRRAAVPVKGDGRLADVFYAVE